MCVYGGEVQCHYTLKRYLRSKVGLGPLPSVAECGFLVFANSATLPLWHLKLCVGGLRMEMLKQCTAAQSCWIFALWLSHLSLSLRIFTNH